MPDLATLAVSALVALVVVLTIRGLFRRVRVFEYEQGLIYRNGKFERTVGPGGYLTYVGTTTIRTVDTRISVETVPGQELVTADGISVKLSLLVQHRVVDAPLAVHGVDSYHNATYTLAQVALREVVGGLSLDDVLARRGELGAEVLARCAAGIRKFGVELVAVEIKDLMLPGPTKRMLGQVVEARQRGLAALEKARGETAALRSLANAARMVEANPALLQLRLLQQLEGSSGNTVLLGMPPSGTPIPVKQVEGGTADGAAARTTPDPEG